MELNNDDVMSLSGEATFKAGSMLKVVQLYTAAANYLGSPHSNWFQEKGISCEVLKVEGGGWQKGKIRFRVEFIPDEIEIPQQELLH